MNISGIDKARLIQELHNNAPHSPTGTIARFHDLGRDMTYEEAKHVLEGWNHDRGEIRLDYLSGRPLKVTITDDELINARLYDRDAGPGMAETIVGVLRQEAR